MGPVWEPRAPEIQRMLDEGWSIGAIAKHFGAKRHVMRSKMSQLRKKGLLQYEDRATHHDDYARDMNEIKVNSGAKESVELLRDGSYSSEKPLWMTLENVTDSAYLLRAHGFNPDNWELITARNNRWNAYSKQDGIMILYASKITVKPRTQGWTFDDLVRTIRETKPIDLPTYPPIHTSDKRLIEISLFDMHFGNSPLELYKQTQRDIYDKLNSRVWEETLFVIGQDLFHHDNFRSTTASGTVIQNADMPSAWRDSTMFYEVLIQTAIRQSGRVKIVYAKGNHDESFSWAFVQYLKARFPQVEFDDGVRERKVHIFHNCFIGITHGDKARKTLMQLFPAEFPMEWGQTRCREIHAGDLHREDLKGMDEFGVMFRTLATKNRTDQWHDDQGYTTAHKRFMLFEYDETTLKHIHYV